MKTILATTLSVTTLLAFVLSYFCKLTLDNVEQYLAVVGVVFMDGFFGIIAGIKREGFKTYKAVKVVKTLFSWVLILTTVLMVEKGITGTAWLSETVLIPFIVFQFISVIKNAGDAGFINNELMLKILEKIDKHKS
jgi:hypothetical protein